MTKDAPETIAVRSWRTTPTPAEIEVRAIIVDKLLDSHLGVPGEDSRDQRANTLVWASVFLEALIADKPAARKVASVLVGHDQRTMRALLRGAE